MVHGVRSSRFFCFVVLLYVDATHKMKNGYGNCGSSWFFFYRLPASMQEDKSKDPQEWAHTSSNYMLWTERSHVTT